MRVEKYVKIVSDNPQQVDIDPDLSVINNQDVYISRNGTYTAAEGYTGIGKAFVNVPSEEPVIEPLNVTPNVEQQIIEAGVEENGFSPIIVSAVTSSIDSNIKSANIKSGVEILGVTGNLEELNGETQTVSLTGQEQTFTPTGNKNGITSITVQAHNKNITIDPSTSQQHIGVSSGYSGNGAITVNRVTDTIDSNIAAGNIKEGVSILGVSGSVVELKGSTKTINPSTSSQTVSPVSPSNGFTEVTVPAVTAAIDSNITAGNIKSGVSILGVNGSVVELKSETRYVSLTGRSQTYTPTTGKNGIASITVTAIDYGNDEYSENFIITPTTQEQYYPVPSGYAGFTDITVNPVTSSIDANIQASNIKSGVTILGVSGSVVELNGTTANINPSTSSQTVTPTSPNNGFTSVTVPAVTSSIDANIVAGNIKSGVSILGVVGTVEPEPNIYRILTTDNGKLIYDSAHSGLHGPQSTSFTDVGDYACIGLYRDSVWGEIIEAGYTAVSGKYAFWYAFENATVADIVFENLQTVSGANAFECAFFNLKDADDGICFESLTTVSGPLAFNNAFTSAIAPNCNIDFSHLLTASGANCFEGAFSGGSFNSIDFSGVTSVGSKAFSFAFAYADIPNGVSFDSLTTVALRSFDSAFQETNIGTTMSFPALVSITKDSVFSESFSYNEYIESISFPALKNANARTVFSYGFSGCVALTSINFDKLQTVGVTAYPNTYYSVFEHAFSESALTTVNFRALENISSPKCFDNAFSDCYSLQDLYFPALKSTYLVTEDKRPFMEMLASCENVTVHFPIAMQTVIGSWADVVAGFDGTNTTVLFDLAQTLVGADNNTYQEFFGFNTDTACCWRIGTTRYYTSGKMNPQVGDTIYSDANCTTAVTTVASRA